MAKLSLPKSSPEVPLLFIQTVFWMSELLLYETIKVERYFRILFFSHFLFDKLRCQVCPRSRFPGKHRIQKTKSISFEDNSLPNI